MRQVAVQDIKEGMNVVAMGIVVQVIHNDNGSILILYRDGRKDRYLYKKDETHLPLQVATYSQ